MTKHGVVALTENLYSDLQNQNLKVNASVLCPGFVNTNIHDSSRNRQQRLVNDGDPGPTAEQLEMRKNFKVFLEQGMQPEQLAEVVFDGIRAERLYILTHTEFDQMIQERAKNITSGTNPTPMSF